MPVVRSVLSTWQRMASLEKYEPHTHSSRMAFRRDAIAQCCIRRGLCSSMLGCRMSSGQKLYPQQSRSRIDYHPELSPIRRLAKDGHRRSPISPIFELSAA